MSKTVTEYFRQPCFDDAVVFDDRTETAIVHREHSDGENWEGMPILESTELRGMTAHEIAESSDIILMACG